MINIIIILIVILNIFSVLTLFNMLKGLEIKFRIIITISLIFINIILTNIICLIGQASVTKEFANIGRLLLIFSILPINLIIMASPLAIQINKVKSLEIDKAKFLKNIFICFIIDFILIIIECNYVKGIISGIIQNVQKK